jgi:hypothetical protein
MTGRADRFVDDDVEELARLYTWLYSCDTIPRCFPIKRTLLTDLCLDEGVIDMFECLIRHASCIDYWTSDAVTMSVCKEDAECGGLIPTSTNN